jgi:DNA-directed RNA polymerase specialized sigma24 family protein
VQAPAEPVTERAEDALARQGFTGARLLTVAYDVANAYCRRTGSALDSRIDDLAQFLAMTGCQLAITYDPVRVRPGYSFSSYVYDVLQRRCVDWHRRKSEGLADRRYFAKGIEPRGDMDALLDGTDPFKRALELEQQESGDAFEEAEQAILVAVVGLSKRAVLGLHLLRLEAEGYKVAGIGTLTARRVAQEELRERLTGRP